MKKFLNWPTKSEQPTQDRAVEQGFANRVIEIGKRIFDTNASGNRTETVLRLVERPLNDEFVRSALPDLSLTSVRQELEKIADAATAEEYGAQLLRIFKPFLELAQTHPTEFGEMRRRNFLAGGEFVRINDIVSYGISGDDLYIHFSPAEDMTLGKARELFTQGLHNLAKVLEKHDEVKVISATSWMVAAQPKLIERFGFTVEGPIDEETRMRDFALETRPVNRASISREDFLQKYRV